MEPTDVQDAIEKVREVHRRVIDGQRFRGYSGRARALGGTLALAAAFVLSRGWFPPTARAHLEGWGAVCAAAMLLNYGALLLWLLLDPEVRRDLRQLRPTVDSLPPIFVGGVITAVLAAHGQFDSLPGAWMLLFGLANLSSRQHVPRVAWPVGAYYLVCGTVLLANPIGGFLNPWPMGVVFFIGEWAGGLAFFRLRNPSATFVQFFGLRGRTP